MAPIRPRARGVLLGSVIGLAALAGACGPKIGASRRAPEGRAGELPGGPPPPTRGLDMPSLAVEWTPPMLAAGDVSGLAAALARHPQVTVALGPRLAGETWELRAAALVAALSPGTRVVERTHAELAALAGPEAELRAPRRTTPAASGRPRYAAALQVKVGGPTLALDDVAVDLPRWQALASSSVGSCDAAMRALADGQELGLARLAPFLDHADGLLARLYREELRAFLPALANGLAAPRSGPAEACRRAYAADVASLGRCAADADGECAGTPRVVLAGGVKIAAAAPGFAAASGCAAQVGRDVPAELRRLAQAAAESASARLDRGWLTLADRLGTLTEVHAALDDVCTPRRRRFAAADLAEARARLVAIGAALASEDLGAQGGRWSAGGEAITVPGMGAMQTLLRFDGGPGAVNAGIVADARALREFVLARALCKAGHAANPLAALVADPQGGPAFLGYFYEEELFCGPLPPLAG
ncbi:MAG: hypothetical protein JNL82_20200 [Myxococcales bacterium]|nr:hypothetical protein [Myxococcales bacterium]